MTYASEKRRLERKHQAEEAAARIEAIRDQIGQKGAKDWAYQLRDRERAGDKLTPALRKAWRDALGVES